MSLLAVGDEHRKKRSRNVVLGALAVLLILWTVRISFPQHTVLSVYSNHSPFASAPPLSIPEPTGTAKKQMQNPEDTIGPKFNVSQSIKAAVIIETRFRSNLIPLILHFKSVLGPTWPIIIYTAQESASRFAASAALNRYLYSGIIEVRILPGTVLFTNSDSVNAFMTKSWLWESLSPAEHILVFQSDSMLCGNAARSVDDYFEFDLVGAPIASRLGKGYNGGLSLRKSSTTLRVLKHWDWEETQAAARQVPADAVDADRFEDQWYFSRMLDLQAEEIAAGVEMDDEGAISLPSMETARTFAVETIDFPHPLGVHQVHRWLKASDHILSLDEWCPEYKLCSTEHIVDTHVADIAAAAAASM